MKIFLHICAIFLIGVFISCGKRETPLFPKVISLNASILRLGDSLGYPLKLNVVDNNLIVRDENDGTCFTVLNLDNSSCRHFGNRGQGPNEYIDPISMLLKGNTSRVFSIYDAAKKQLLTYSLDSLQNKIDVPISITNLETEGTIITMAILNDSVGLATGSFRNGNRFAIFNSKGEIIKSLGKYGIEKEDSYPFYIKGAAFVSFLTVHPSCGRFALATRYGGMIELFEYDILNLKINKICEGVNLFPPHIAIGDYNGTPNFIPDHKTRWGYLCIDSDADYIYSLYSGCYQNNSEPFTSGNVIHVLNWDGKTVCELKLDRRLSDMVICHGKLYGLCNSDELGFYLVKYDLPENYE